MLVKQQGVQGELVNKLIHTHTCTNKPNHRFSYTYTPILTLTYLQKRKENPEK